MFIAVLALAMMTNPEVGLDRKEYRCMKLAIYKEARGESIDGMRAVANVIVNRTLHDEFPDSVCEVVFQRNNNRCQFSWVCQPGKKIPTKFNEDIEKVARQALTAKHRKDNTNGALYFRTTHVPGWMGSKETKKIGNHYFYMVRSQNVRKQSTEKDKSAKGRQPVFSGSLQEPLDSSIVRRDRHRSGSERLRMDS